VAIFDSILGLLALILIRLGSTFKDQSSSPQGMPKSHTFIPVQMTDSFDIISIFMVKNTAFSDIFWLNLCRGGKHKETAIITTRNNQTRRKMTPA